MSAPEDAKPLGYSGWELPDGTIQSEEEVKNDPIYRVRCSCGWRGHMAELLGVDEEDTLWCPQCRTAGWEFQ